MASPPVVYACGACHHRAEVSLVDDALTAAHPNSRPAVLRAHLRHATCPRCGGRDPDAVAAHVRGRRRQRYFNGAFIALIALASIRLPWVALIVPGMWLLIWLLAFQIRWRRRNWFSLIQDVVMPGALIAWYVVDRAHVWVPVAALALWALVQRDSSSPFEDAAERLRFSDSPYRG